jgi:rubrerythrin
MLQSINDVIALVCSLEERSEKFYGLLSKHLKDKHLKNLALKLSLWEEGHVDILAKILTGDAEKLKINSTKTNEKQINTIQSIAENKVFNVDPEKFIEGNPGSREILLLALEMEKKMVLIYRALYKLNVILDDVHFLNIINEETQHIDFINEKIAEL